MKNMKGHAKVAWWLMWIGALNWGLIGIGNFLGSDWNVVGLLLGSVPTLENIVYVLVGLSAVVACSTCKK